MMEQYEEPKLTPLEDMSFEEMVAEAKGYEIPDPEKMDRPLLNDQLVVKRFTSNRKNQTEAIRRAKEIKEKSNGTWFTLEELRSTTRPISKVKGRIVYGSPTATIEELNALMHTLNLFGLMKRNVRPGKRTKYKVRFGPAARAIEDHNRNMKAAKIIGQSVLEKSKT